ncbi:MAG: ATP-binding protein [bacterium]
MKNPFPVGIPAKSDDLIGREKELESISKMLMSGQSVILISPRRYGKTSLSLEILRRLKKEGCYTLYLDIFSILDRYDLARQITEKTLENKKIRNFSRMIREKFATLLKSIEFKQVIEEFEFVLKFKDEGVDEWELLRETLNFPDKIGIKENKKMVVVFDEFGDLAKLNGLELLKLMRSIFQLQEKTSYLFTGSQESVMNELFLSREQPFFRFGIIQNLNLLPLDRIRRYVEKKFSQEGIAINSEHTDFIAQKTKGHPYYTQLLCQRIYFNLLGKNTIEKEDIERAYLDAILEERNFFEQLWTELLGKRHYRDALRTILFSKKPLYSIKELKEINLSRILRGLKGKGIIKKTNQAYEIADPFFKEYLILRFSEKIL